MKVEERQETAAEEAVDSCFLIFLIQSTKELVLQMIQEMALDIVDFRVEEKNDNRIEVITKHVVDEYSKDLSLSEELSETRKLFGLLPFIAASLLTGTT